MGQGCSLSRRRHASLSDQKRRAGTARLRVDRRNDQSDGGGLLLRMPSFASVGSRPGAETGRGARMIDWNHPRIYERLRCFGLTLFTLGIASHNEANPPVAVAAILVATLLVVRLRIELGIGRDEERSSLERKLRRIDLINALAIVPAA